MAITTELIDGLIVAAPELELLAREHLLEHGQMLEGTMLTTTLHYILDLYDGGDANPNRGIPNVIFRIMAYFETVLELDPDGENANWIGLSIVENSWQAEHRFGWLRACMGSRLRERLDEFREEMGLIVPNWPDDR